MHILDVFRILNTQSHVFCTSLVIVNSVNYKSWLVDEIINILYVPQVACSSEPSAQSVSPSHSQAAAMQVPDLHLNSK